MDEQPVAGAEPRGMVSVRISPAGQAALRARAHAEGISVSELQRRLLSYGLQEMPTGWAGHARQ